MVVGTLPVYLGKCSVLCPCETPAQSPEAWVEVIKSPGAMVAVV